MSIREQLIDEARLEAERRARGVPDCECGFQMDLGSYSPDGSGCDWICWECIRSGNPPGNRMGNARIASVLRLHRRSEYRRNTGGTGKLLPFYCMEDGKDWPCPTVRAIEDAA